MSSQINKYKKTHSKALNPNTQAARDRAHRHQLNRQHQSLGRGRFTVVAEKVKGMAPRHPRVPAVSQRASKVLAQYALKE
eukprot:1840543-Amphidinium_carterae.1